MSTETAQHEWITAPLSELPVGTVFQYQCDGDSHRFELLSNEPDDINSYRVRHTGEMYETHLCGPDLIGPYRIISTPDAPEQQPALTISTDSLNEFGMMFDLFVAKYGQEVTLKTLSDLPQIGMELTELGTPIAVLGSMCMYFGHQILKDRIEQLASQTESTDEALV